MKSTRKEKRIIRHRRVRAKIAGIGEVPRVSVFRSNRHIYVQAVDDSIGKTLVSAHDISKTKNKDKKTDQAAAVGQSLAKKLKELKISKIVFDRGGFKYHGRVKALAEALRKGGLEF